MQRIPLRGVHNWKQGFDHNEIYDALSQTLRTLIACLPGYGHNGACMHVTKMKAREYIHADEETNTVNRTSASANGCT